MNDTGIGTSEAESKGLEGMQRHGRYEMLNEEIRRRWKWREIGDASTYGADGRMAAEMK